MGRRTLQPTFDQMFYILLSLFERQKSATFLANDKCELIAGFTATTVTIGAPERRVPNFGDGKC